MRVLRRGRARLMVAVAAAVGSSTLGLVPVIVTAATSAHAATAPAPTPGARAVADVAHPSTPKPPAAPAASPQAPPETALEQAIDRARSTHQSQTVDALTTATTQTVANPDGSVTETRSATPVRWQDSSGAWQPLDLSMVTGSDGRLGPRSAPPGAARIGNATPGSAVQVATPAGTVSFGPADVAAVGPRAHGNQVDFPSALSGGRTVSEKALVDGAEETVTLPDAAAGGSWTDTFQLPAGVTAKPATGGVAFVDGSDAQVGFYHDGTAADSFNGGVGIGDDTPVTVTLLGQTGSTAQIGVAVDPGWLASPARTFPVLVDPTFTYSGNTNSAGSDAYTDNVYHTTTEGTYDPSYLKVGTYNGQAEVDRSYVQFPSTGIDNSEDVINSATLSLYDITSWSCNLQATPAITAVEAAGAWNASTITWDNQPNARAGSPATNVVADYGYSGCPANWLSFNVTGQVQDWANGVADNGFYIGTDEANNYGWKVFDSGEDGASVAPQLSINYNNCTAYTSAATGTHQVCGAIRDKYNQMGGPSSILGYPTTDETPTPDGVGRFNHFLNTSQPTNPDGNNGSIYWTPNWGAWSIHGLNRAEWENTGWETNLGYPVTDETGTPNGLGRFNHFRRLSGGYVSPIDGDNASIYYSGATGSHEIQGTIRDKWATMGWETSYLAFPSSDQYATPGGLRNDFQGGQINDVTTAGTANGQIEATSGTTAGAGTPGEYTFSTYQLDDNLTAKANVGTGNLNLGMQLLDLPGVMSDAALSLNYNSAYTDPGNPVSGLTGPGWRVAPFGDVYLVTHADGSATYYDASGTAWTYVHDANATNGFDPPPGQTAALVHTTSPADWAITDSSGTKYDFGSGGGPVLSQTDRNGNKVTYGGGAPATITGTRAGGNPVTVTYGGCANAPSGYLCKVSQTNDGVTHSFAFAYNASTNTLASVTEHASGSSSVAIPADRTTSFSYDGSNRLTQITDPVGVVTKIGYGTWGHGSQVTSFAQDAGSGGINATTTTAYTVATSNDVTLHDADSGSPYNHGPSTYTVDGFGRVASVTDPLGRSRATTWSPASQASSTDNGSDPASQFGYDATNHALDSQSIPTGATATINYGGAAAYAPASSTDPQGNTTSYSYDTNYGGNNQTQSSVNGTITASETWNEPGQAATCGGVAGEQCSATDADGNKTSFSYDSSGDLTTVTPPSGGALKPTTYTTSQSGKTDTVTDGRGNTTTYSYDAFGRLAKVTVGSLTVTYGYDADGHTTSRVDSSGTTTYTFDHLNRLTKEQLPNDTTAVSSTFDPVGNRLTYTDRTGTVTYAYDADDELTSEADPGGSCTSNPTSQCTTFTYDTNGNRLTTTYPGGTVLTTHSDTSSRHDEAKAINGSTTLFDYRYSYANSSGKDQAVITSRTNALASPNQSLTYSYNNQDELTGAVQNTGPGTATTASWLYCYDPAGNRTGDTTTIGATTCPTTAGSGSDTYGYDPSGALTSRNGSTSGFSYDANGNQTAGRDSQTITGETYNAFNQLTASTVGTSTTTNAYSGTTNAERTTTGTASVDNGPLGLTASTTGGTTTGYTRDPNGTLIDERTPNGTRYYLYDGTGNVVAVADNTGTQTATYTYDPYGNTTVTTGTDPNPFKYNAGYQDPNGLYHYGARYYDPSTGRFTQPDPSGQNPGYLYAGNDPVNSSDLSGLSSNGCTGVFPWDAYELCISVVGEGTYVNYIDVTVFSNTSSIYGYLSIDTYPAYTSPDFVLNNGDIASFEVTFDSDFGPGEICGALNDAVDEGPINKACETIEP